MTVSVTKESIDAKIVREAYQIVPHTTTTVCALTMENGFVQIGSSACVDVENFDAKIGRDIARENAFEKLWALEGYLLREEIYRGTVKESEDASDDETVQVHVIDIKALADLISKHNSQE